MRGLTILAQIGAVCLLAVMATRSLCAQADTPSPRTRSSPGGGGAARPTGHAQVAASYQGRFALPDDTSQAPIGPDGEAVDITTITGTLVVDAGYLTVSWTTTDTVPAINTGAAFAGGPCAAVFPAPHSAPFSVNAVCESRYAGAPRSFVRLTWNGAAWSVSRQQLATVRTLPAGRLRWVRVDE